MTKRYWAKVQLKRFKYWLLPQGAVIRMGAVFYEKNENGTFDRINK